MSGVHIQGESSPQFHLLFTYVKHTMTHFKKNLPVNNQPTEAVKKQLFAPLGGSKQCMLTSTKNYFHQN